MGIYDLIETVLDPLHLPYFAGETVFDGDPPDTWIGYAVQAEGAQYADDDCEEQSFTVDMNLFSPSIRPELHREVIRMFTQAGFSYVGDGDLPIGSTFSNIKNHYFEFHIILERS